MMQHLYNELDLARRATLAAYADMESNPCDKTIEAYEFALDDEARARFAIKAANDADMAERAIRACRKPTAA
jgi:siroheme synthase (precorrin-2 oxidase/ferrochelatase)